MLNFDLLKKLCETPGVPGREARVRDVIMAELRPVGGPTWVDEIRVESRAIWRIGE